MEAWVTDADRGKLPLRMHVSMLGLLGIGGHLGRWTQEEREVARKHSAAYKSIRHTVQQGDQYRLRSAQAGPFSAVQYVSKDRSGSVLFAFRTHLPRSQEALPPLYLRGLEGGALYEVEGFPGVRSGAAWMHAGLTLKLGDFESTVRGIRRVEGTVVNAQ